MASGMINFENLDKFTFPGVGKYDIPQIEPVKAYPQGEFIRFRMFCLHKNLPLIPSLFLPVPPPRSVRKGEGAHFLYYIPPLPFRKSSKNSSSGAFSCKNAPGTLY